MARTTLIFVVFVALVRTASFGAEDSIPGDVNCDAILTAGDLFQLEMELADGDGDSAADLDGGKIVSCRGADANADGIVTVADLSALSAFLSGVGTPQVASGPVVTYLGIASADGTLARPVREGRVPTYQSAGGIGFVLVVEAAVGPSGRPPSLQLIRTNPEDTDFRPGLEVEATRDLGDGSPAVCDQEDEGGVPAVTPPGFAPVPSVMDALRDFSCRFASTTNPGRSCVVDGFGLAGFADSRTRAQYCFSVSGRESFADGSTMVTARVLDTAGNEGVVSQMIVHVGTDPLPTVTSTPTDTPRPTPTITATVTSTRTVTATRTRIPTRTLTRTATRTPTFTRTPRISVTPVDSPTGPVPRTSTRTQTRTATVDRGTSPSHTVTSTPTRTATSNRTASRTRTVRSTSTQTPTRTATRARTGDGGASPTRTVRFTRTHTATRTLAGTRTRTPTRTATRTPTSPDDLTPTHTRRPTRTQTGTVTGTITRSPTITRTPTQTPTVTPTHTVTLTPTITPTPSVTPTATDTRPPTPTLRPGADVSFVGLARSDDVLVPPAGVTAEGWPIFERPIGFNFTVVVEGKPGPSRRPVGTSTFDSDSNDPSVRADLEIIVSRPLGDGSLAVCDDELPFLGGVPASSSFDEEQAISGAINDFACRFVDGAGNRLGRPPSDACTRAPDGSFKIGGADSTVQFCGLIASLFGFPEGDTLVSVRLRDQSGRPGPPQSFVVRISR